MLSLLSQPTKNRREADHLISKYPERIPVIVKKNELSKTTPDIDKHKFLVPVDLTIGQFLYVIRKRLQLPPDKGMFLFIDGCILPNNELIHTAYNKSHDRNDGFLYAVYSCENVFG